MKNEFSTDAQKRVLKHLSTFIEKEGYVPSYRQLIKDMGLASTSTVKKHLDKLKEKGYITWIVGQLRTLKIIRNEDF